MRQMTVLPKLSHTYALSEEEGGEEGREQGQPPFSLVVCQVK